MSDYHDWDSIQVVTPTLCELAGITPPSLCVVSPLRGVLQAAEATFDGQRLQRSLVFAPDALGNHVFLRVPSLLECLRRSAGIEVFLRSVVPAKTPVCFASMFTGAEPCEHGIVKYEKPALACDTVFDAFRRAGKRIAIVAVAESSIDRIFRGRDIDYYSERYDPEVTAQVISLLEADRHDFIVAYQQEYDDVLHRGDPLADDAIRAAFNHIAALEEIAQPFDRCWSRYDRAMVFAPDHGAHVDPETGKGDHGEDIPEDMELRHFWRLCGARGGRMSGVSGAPTRLGV